MIRSWLEKFPLIAILRGLTPEEAVPVGRALADAGFAIIEVPLNSPRPLDSIRLLRADLGDRCLIGAGTVLDPDAVNGIKAAGGQIVVMPHGDPAVIRAAKAAGLICLPGIATPTEGFAALANGADALKLFPAEVLGVPFLKAIRAVFPKDTLFLPVGGVTPDNLGEYVAAGAAGFGIGSALYRPGLRPNAVAQTARAFVDAWERARPAGAKE